MEIIVKPQTPIENNNCDHGCRKYDCEYCGHDCHDCDCGFCGSDI